MSFFDIIEKIPAIIGEFIDNGWQYAALAGLFVIGLIFLIIKVFF